MNIEKRLQQWALWSNANVDNIGYKSVWESIERNAPAADPSQYLHAPAGVDALMSDGDAALIDRAVSRMMKSAPLLCGIIRKWYLRKNTAADIARYYLTPLTYPAEIGLDWDDAGKSKVRPRVVTSLLRQAREVVELELELIQNEKYLAARNRKFNCQSPVTRKYCG